MKLTIKYFAEIQQNGIKFLPHASLALILCHLTATMSINPSYNKSPAVQFDTRGIYFGMSLKHVGTDKSLRDTAHLLVGCFSLPWQDPLAAKFQCTPFRVSLKDTSGIGSILTICLEIAKIICDKVRGKSIILRKRPSKYSNQCHEAKNKKPESALNKTLSGKL